MGKSNNKNYENILKRKTQLGIEELEQAADIFQQVENREITHLMYLIWQSRQDLQQAFDLETTYGQQKFCQWYDISLLGNHKSQGLLINGQVQNEEITSNPLALGDGRKNLYSRLLQIESAGIRIGKCFPASIRRTAKRFWHWGLAIAAKIIAQSNSKTRDNSSSLNLSQEVLFEKNVGLPGANLVGYAQTESGMGEHVRMTAAALDTTDTKFSVIDFSVGVPSRQNATLDCGDFATSNRYRANIFHVNADQLVNTYCYFGRDFFCNRYNILYPFWELAIWPDEWVSILQLVEEIWAPSRFIQMAISQKTTLPVQYMPVGITLPLRSGYKRFHFNLPEDMYLFLFTFDSFSYIERKNPLAIVQSFRKAFPEKNKKVGLVIKAMNANPKNKQWEKMLNVINEDPRIYIINKTMCRSEILDLVAVSDCYVSLHRSEGFGRGPAEAMYLKKPVIVTNYSGNTDFTLPGNSCLVDYDLIPMGESEYLHSKGQQWADPDIDHAAWYMRKLVADSVFARSIAERGENFIRTKFSPKSVAENYSRRFQELKLI